ncbi:MAG: hypothetical protein ACOYON_13775 [Fimbriimonas sp.]
MRSPFDTIEELAGSPSGGPLQKWGGGVVAPLVLLWPGVSNLITQSATFPSRSPAGRIALTGPSAIGLGIATIGLALFLHFHFFWGLSDRLEPYSTPLKAVACVVFVGGFGFVLS